MRKSLDFDMVRDHPRIMRQDPLTQLPVCPSAASKHCPVSSVLTRRLSAAVCFGHNERDGMVWERNQWSVWDKPSESTRQRPGLRRRDDGEEIDSESWLLW